MSELETGRFVSTVLYVSATASYARQSDGALEKCDLTKNLSILQNPIVT